MKIKALWPREKAFEWIKMHKIVAIIKTRNAAQARSTVEALIKGGFKLIEVSMAIVGAAEIIRDFSKRPGILVGAGSVLSENSAQAALSAGAQFLMTPHTDAKVLKLAKKADAICLTGALTPTEMVNAWLMGADIVRVFPVRSAGGASYIHALKDVLTEVPLMPSGGITLETMRDYFLAGATAVGTASSLVSETAVENGRWGEITAQAKRFQEVLQRL